ncbi:carboxylesterase family protein [alpha proteobacterium U9-1i]|nr:carboxylesterase family protein [alpha proteobacterium U9-1i]
MLRRTFFAALPALLAACTPSLGAFNRWAPHDAGARRVLTGAAYGTDARQKLDAYAPVAPAGAPMPVIVFIYGGSWDSGARGDYGFVGDAFAARGFLALVPDYRLVPDVRFPGFVEDCAAAVAWAHANAAAHGGDPNNIVLVGHSAGAYNVMMLALDAHFLRDAGVPAGAVRGAIGLAGPYDFLPFDVNSTRAAFGQTTDAQTTQPVSFARSDAPPLLLLWGERDTTVGPRNLEGLERAVHTAGGRVETKRYPRVDHVGIMLALSRPFRRRAPVLDDVTAFAQRVTGHAQAR